MPLICDKGDMLLYALEDQKNAYRMVYEFKNIDPERVNINALLGTGIYSLLEKINPDLIERIQILDQISPSETVVVIVLKQIGKKVGIRPKYMLFKTTKSESIKEKDDTEEDNDTEEDRSIIFDNSAIPEEQRPLYLEKAGINQALYQPMRFVYGRTVITPHSLNLHFEVVFKLQIDDELPIYMEHLIGLMYKKIFYNLKRFVEQI